jgi:hypothetical protein
LGRLAGAVAVAAAALAGVPIRAHADSASPAQHVAIYVAGVGTACSTLGANGMADLTSAYDVVVGANPHNGLMGMVLVIDGVGNANSVQPKYWSYWHWQQGRWVYSQTGAAGYHPKAGAVEGWAFGSYGANDQPPLPAADYAGVCGNEDVATSKVTSSASKPAAATTHSSSQTRSAGAQPSMSSGHSSTAPRSSRTPATSMSVENSTPMPTPTSARASSTAASVSATPSHSDLSTSPPVAGNNPAAFASATLAAAPAKAQSTSAGGPSAGFIVASAVILGLGGFAAWRWRGHRSDHRP